MADTEVTPGRKQAPAGKYKLKAIWNELVSELNAPKDFIKHLPGDIVELSTEVAERFLRHGLAEPLPHDEEAKASDAATTPTPADKAKAITAQMGQQPIAEGEQQQPINNPVPAPGAPPTPPLT